MEANKKANTSSRDVISTLPDDLLCHILCFLSTKEAALTSVLSKRWSHLLQSVPVLDLDDSVLLNPRMGQRHIGVFKDFVDRLLSRLVKNSSPVKRVSLKFRHAGVERHRVIRWIRTVMYLGVVDFSLRLDCRIFDLPVAVFTSKTLVSLRIGTTIRLSPSLSASVFPMLDSLVLDSVEFWDTDLGFKPVLLTLPFLQNLWILESSKYSHWNGCMSSPTLKKFVYRNDCESSVPKACVSFDTPNLVYLEYTDMVAAKYENLKLGSLVEARIDLQLTANQIMRKTAPNIGFVPGDVTTLFMGLRNVMILCLSPDALDALYYRGERIPVFNNLIRLSLGSDKPHGSPYIFWKLLPSMLLSSINLETLIIKGLIHYVKEGWENVCRLRISWDEVSASLLASVVKVLKITRYKGTSQELNQLKRFLGKLSYLERVEIYHKAVDDGERFRLMNELLLLPKASSKCKIQLRKETV